MALVSWSNPEILQQQQKNVGKKSQSLESTGLQPTWPEAASPTHSSTSPKFLPSPCAGCRKSHFPRPPFWNELKEVTKCSILSTVCYKPKCRRQIRHHLLWQKSHVEDREIRKTIPLYQGGSAYPIVFPLTQPPFGGPNRSFSGRYNLTRDIYIYLYIYISKYIYMDVSENSGFYPKSSMD